MSRKNNLNPKTRKYEPTTVGKGAMIVTAPAAIIGMVSVIVGIIVPSMVAVCFDICIISEGIAFVGGIVLVIDMILFNRRMAKEIAKNKKEQPVKQEKDIANIAHLLAGLAIGLFLGYMFWGRN